MNEKDFEVKILLDIKCASIGVAAFDYDTKELSYDEARARGRALRNLQLDGLIENVVRQTFKLTDAGHKAASILDYSLNKAKERMES